MFLTWTEIVPQHRALHEVFKRMQVSGELLVDFGTERWQFTLQFHVIVHSLGQHFRKDIDGFLESDLPLIHYAEHEILIVAIGLLFLMERIAVNTASQRKFPRPCLH